MHLQLLFIKLQVQKYVSERRRRREQKFPNLSLKESNLFSELNIVSRCSCVGKGGAGGGDGGGGEGVEGCGSGGGKTMVLVVVLLMVMILKV